MATMLPPQKGVEYITYVNLVSQANTMLFQSNPTLASGDVTVTTDGNAVTNLDTLPAVDPAASYFVKVTVSATEMNGDNIAIVFNDVAGDEWCDLGINIQTSAQSFDTTDAAVDAIPTTAMRGTDNAALASSWTAALATVLGNYTAARAGYLDELAAANLPADVDILKTYCDILDHATNGLANIKSLIDTLDTVADAIKAVTDLLPNAGALSDLATILTDTGELQTDWADGGRLDLLIDAITTYVDLIDDATNGLAAIKAEVEGLAGAAMRGTDNAALATALATHDTEVKAEVDANESLITTVDTVVDGIQTDLDNGTDGLGALKTLIDALDAVLTTMKQQAAGTFNRETDSLQAIRDRGDAAWITGAGGSAPTVEEIDTELTAEHGSGSWVGLTAIEFEED